MPLGAERTASAAGEPDKAALDRQSPTRLTRSEWRAAGKGALAHTKADRVNVVGGSLAYRWFLSMFPALIALLGVTSLLQLPSSVVDRLIHGAASALPSGASGVLTSAIRHAQHRASGALVATIIAAAVALFSATSSMTVLQTGLDMAYEIPSDRKFLAKRLVALELMVAVAVLGGAASALIVLGAQIGHGIGGFVPIGGSLFDAVWTAVRWIAAVVLVCLLFSFIYWIGPNRESPRWQWLTPGAVVGTLLWVLVSLAFSFYTSSFGSYGKTYGAFAGVAILILWLYATGAVVLLGAELNAELERTRAGRTRTEGATTAVAPRATA